MKLNNATLKPGDVILEDWKPDNSLLAWVAKMQRIVDKGKYNHAILYLGEGMAIHAAQDGIKVFELKTGYTNMAVYRPVIDIVPIEIQTAAADYQLDAEEEGCTGYSYLGLLGASLGALTKYFLGKKHQFIREEGNPFCSELTTEITDIAEEEFVNQFLISLGIDPYDEDPDALVTPCDYTRTDMYYRVD